MNARRQSFQLRVLDVQLVRHRQQERFAHVRPQPFQVLLGTPVGWGCLLTGLALDAAGLWWTARLARSAADG